MPVLRLKAGREKSLLRRHPWIYSGAIAKVDGNPKCGETVAIVDSRGAFLAWGAYSPISKIRSRVWSWVETDTIDETFFKKKLKISLQKRDRGLSEFGTDAYRLVHAESDGLPGLIVDRYADVIVLQSLSCGVEFWKDTIVTLLAELTEASWVYERSDVHVRELEGLQLRKGVLYRRSNQSESSFPMVQIQEHSMRFWVDVQEGQKTGFYLDQRDNRKVVGELAQGKRVLDCFSYTGGFTCSALSAGAISVISVDSSPLALNLLKENLKLNEISVDRVNCVVGDVFHVLRT